MNHDHGGSSTTSMTNIVFIIVAKISSIGFYFALGMFIESFLSHVFDWIQNVRRGGGEELLHRGMGHSPRVQRVWQFGH